MPGAVVGDIDRGGVLAAVFGALALLEEADRALSAGFVVNKLRGPRELLESGLEILPSLEMLRGLMGRSVFRSSRSGAG